MFALLKRFAPRTLIGRSVTILVTPMIVVQVVATWAFYDRHWDIVTKRLVSTVAGDIAMVIDGMEAFPGRENRDAALRVSETAGLRSSFAAGASLPGQAPAIGGGILDRRLSRALSSKLGRPYHMETEGYGDWIRIKVQLTDGLLDVFVKKRRLFNETTYLFLAWLIGTSLAMIGIAVIFMRNQVRPIRRLAVAVDDFGKGREVPDLSPSGASEIRTLTTAFNLTRARIGRMIAQRTEMLAGVSHDLRTPLTRLKLQLAMLGDGKQIADLKSDVGEMESLVEEYLAFAAGEGTEAVVNADVAPILDEVVSGARRDGVDVDFRAQPGLVIPIRPNAFRRCLTNVISNAVRHAEHVSVRARRTRDTIEIVVDDDGPGIPETAREDVFKPFYRVDDSRNPGTGGTGLGLTIARDVIRGHGGDIRIETAPEGGVRARLRVPV
ncbi:MAG: ATP-binding protein [Defluviicoccus sp.]|nr:ATP-binding protein [Defluviicoccus sp.]